MSKTQRFTIEDLQRKGYTVEGSSAVKKSGPAATVKNPIKRKFGTLDDTIPNRINIEPMSVNKCWKGKRFKTDNYKSYERELARLLQPIELPGKPYKISFEFGFSDSRCDWDNPIKPLQDILQKQYKFNDRDVVEAYVIKKKVKKGSEYLEFKIETSINL